MCFDVTAEPHPTAGGAWLDQAGGEGEAKMQTQLAMRELTLDEIEAVSGAGFWSDLWGSISGAFTASADFLGFDGRFGAGGGSGGFFGAVGNLFGADSVFIVTIDDPSSLLCPPGHSCVPFGPEGGPALRDVSDGAIYYTPEWVAGVASVEVDYWGVARDLSLATTGTPLGVVTGPLAFEFDTLSRPDPNN